MLLDFFLYIVCHTIKKLRCKNKAQRLKKVFLETISLKCFSLPSVTIIETTCDALTFIK